MYKVVDDYVKMQQNTLKCLALRENMFLAIYALGGIEHYENKCICLIFGQRKIMFLKSKI